MKQGLKLENYCFPLSPVLLIVRACLVLRAHFCTHAGRTLNSRPWALEYSYSWEKKKNKQQNKNHNQQQQKTPQNQTKNPTLTHIHKNLYSFFEFFWATNIFCIFKERQVDIEQVISHLLRGRKRIRQYSKQCWNTNKKSYLLTDV